MSKLEEAVRGLFTAVLGLKEKHGLEILLSLTPIFVNIQTIYGEIAGKTKAEYVPLIRQALDNMIGEDPNALIGPKGTLVQFDIPYVPDEMITDFVLSAIEQAMLKE